MKTTRYIHEEYTDEGKLQDKRWFLRIDDTGVVMQFCVMFPTFPATAEICDSVDAQGRRYHASDIGYHSPNPTRSTHKPMEGYCHWVKGGQCYYDGTSLGASRFAMSCGIDDDEAIFHMLLSTYRDWFDKEPDLENAPAGAKVAALVDAQQADGDGGV